LLEQAEQAAQAKVSVPTERRLRRCLLLPSAVVVAARRLPNPQEMEKTVEAAEAVEATQVLQEEREQQVKETLAGLAHSQRALVVAVVPVRLEQTEYPMPTEQSSPVGPEATESRRQ
jgi:hypothetical protein